MGRPLSDLQGLSGVSGRVSNIYNFGSRVDRRAAREISILRNSPRVLVTGARRGIGQACAEALGAQGAELILCDKDITGLGAIADALGATSFFCDVASESSVTSFVEGLLQRFVSLDMLVNAAGGGYERALGMYRMSRALLPALQRGTNKLLLSVPPSPDDAAAAIFPYASSRLGFERLSSALAFEALGMSVTVLIGCPATRRIMQVLPNPNAGTWMDTHDLLGPSREDALALAWQIASLVGRSKTSRRHVL